VNSPNTPEKPPPTDEERRLLQCGDRVRVLRDSGEIEERLVKYAPWPSSAPALTRHSKSKEVVWLIGLAGISGGYLLDRVVQIVSRYNAGGEP
jgi:hypothetical protein